MSAALLGRLAELHRALADTYASMATQVQVPAGDRLLDPGEAAERLGLTRQRVLELARDGALQSRRIGRWVRIPESAVAAFADSTLPTPLAPRGRASAPVVVRPLAGASRRLRGSHSTH